VDTQRAAQEFVPVPTPAEFVTSVMAFIGQLDAGIGVPDGDDGASDQEVSAAEEAALAEDAGKPWTIDELRRIAQGRVYTTRVLTQILDVLADAPSTWMTSVELAAATGRKEQAIRRIWTHVSRHINKWYVGHPWPLEARWGLEFEPARDGVVYYRVSDDQAKAWKEAHAAA